MKKHTKGRIAVEQTETSNWIGTYRVNGKVGEIICETDRDGLKKSALERSDADAQLIADAFNVTNETGFLPRELQKSHAELLEALKCYLDVCQLMRMPTESELDECNLNAEEAINNAKQT